MRMRRGSWKKRCESHQSSRTWRTLWRRRHPRPGESEWFGKQERVKRTAERTACLESEDISHQASRCLVCQFVNLGSGTFSKEWWRGDKTKQSVIWRRFTFQSFVRDRSAEKSDNLPKICFCGAAALVAEAPRQGSPRQNERCLASRVSEWTCVRKKERRGRVRAVSKYLEVLNDTKRR